MTTAHAIDAAEMHITVALRIREARERRGWTQEQLAASVGVNKMTVSRWERGVCLPGLVHARRIGLVLRVSLRWLVAA